MPEIMIHCSKLKQLAPELLQSTRFVEFILSKISDPAIVTKVKEIQNLDFVKLYTGNIETLLKIHALSPKILNKLPFQIFEDQLKAQLNAGNFQLLLILKMLAPEFCNNYKNSQFKYTLYTIKDKTIQDNVKEIIETGEVAYYYLKLKF